jgi:putative peptidoglycan lipid II flippase
MSQMLKSSGAMAAATLTSRLLGMVREMVYARFMGDGWVAGAFQLAFTIPNLFRRLLGEGALTAAFIPIFKEKERTATEQDVWRSANAVISGFLILASVIVALVILGVSAALAVGQFEAQTHLMLRLLRVMFPYMLLVCVAAVLMGMLNARGHFFIPSIGAATMNLVMIASVLWLAPVMGQELHEQIFALAVGVLAAGVAQAAFQLPTLHREGYRFGWVTPWCDETVRRVVQRMLPAIIGVAGYQVNVLLTQTIAFRVDAQIVASFNYAVRLMELPQGLFGVSLATFLLPTLAGLAAEKRYPEFRALLRQGLGTLLFANLIAATLLVVLAEPIIRLLFERGKFTADATDRATFALICLAPGLLAFSVVNVLARAFFALGDTKTPMKISLFCLGLNVVLTLVLVHPFRQGGLGMANTATSTINLVLLAYALRRKLGHLDMAELRNALLPMVVAGAAAGATAWWSVRLWEHSLGHETIALKTGAVFAPALAAALVYWLISTWAPLPAAREINAAIRSRWRKTRLP